MSETSQLAPTDFRCKHCDRPMWRKGTPPEDRPAGSILHSGHGACTTCYHRIYTLGGNDPAPTATPRWRTSVPDFIDTSWHDQGTCTAEDDALFYHPEGERGPARRRRAEAAKAVCRECPVMMKCRAQSLRVREPYGTWGGLSQDERAAVLAGRPLPTAKPPRPRPKPRSKPKPKRAPLVLTIPEIPRYAMGRHVPADRLVAHLRRLHDAGYTFTEIARTAGVAHAPLGVIATGSRASVTERVSRLALAVRPETETVPA